MLHFCKAALWQCPLHIIMKRNGFDSWFVAQTASVCMSSASSPLMPLRFKMRHLCYNYDWCLYYCTILFKALKSCCKPISVDGQKRRVWETTPTFASWLGLFRNNASFLDTSYRILLTLHLLAAVKQINYKFCKATTANINRGQVFISAICN